MRSEIASIIPPSSWGYEFFPRSTSSSPPGLGLFRCMSVSFNDPDLLPSSQLREAVFATASDSSTFNFSDSLNVIGASEGYIQFDDGIQFESNFVINSPTRGSPPDLSEIGFGYLSDFFNIAEKFVATPTQILFNYDDDELNELCDPFGDGISHVSLGPSDNWIVRAHVTIEFAANILEQVFFMINSASLVTIIPDEEYELFENTIREAGGLLEIVCTSEETLIRIPNCETSLENLPVVFITIHSSTAGPAVVVAMEPGDYLTPDCILTIQGETIPPRNYLSYPTIGENVLRHLTVAFDKSHRTIGFCDPNY